MQHAESLGHLSSTNPHAAALPTPPPAYKHIYRQCHLSHLDTLGEKRPCRSRKDFTEFGRNSDPGYLEHDLKGRVWDQVGNVSQTCRLLAPGAEMQWKKTEAWLVVARGLTGKENGTRSTAQKRLRQHSTPDPALTPFSSTLLPELNFLWFMNFFSSKNELQSHPTVFHALDENNSMPCREDHMSKQRWPLTSSKGQASIGNVEQNSFHT